MTLLKYITFSLFLFTVGCTCGKSKKDKNITAENVDSKLKEIVTGIANYPTVDEQIVGIGVPSKQYARFLLLEKQSSEKELLALTDYDNVNVRAYSFWALAKRNYSDLKTVIDKHVNDTSSVHFFSGCFITAYPVNNFFLSVVTPKSPFAHCKKLSKQDLDFYQNKINHK